MIAGFDFVADAIGLARSLVGSALTDRGLSFCVSFEAKSGFERCFERIFCALARSFGLMYLFLFFNQLKISHVSN